MTLSRTNLWFSNKCELIKCKLMFLFKLFQLVKDTRNKMWCIDVVWFDKLPVCHLGVMFWLLPDAPWWQNYWFLKSDNNTFLSSAELKPQIAFLITLFGVCLSFCPETISFSTSTPEPLGQFQPNLAQSINVLGWRGSGLLKWKAMPCFNGS